MKAKILAIIPARSGSKGLIDKNIKLLDSKPLIAYTIEAAIKSNIFSEIIVSTDSQVYKDISIEYGASVPTLRDESIATDTATSMDVILDVIKNEKDRGNSYDYFMLLQPTTPLRTSQDIINALKILEDNKANSVVSVNESKHSPYITNILDESKSMDNFINPKILNKGRQQVEQFYTLNGAIYLCGVDYYTQYKNFYHNNSYAYVMDEYNSIDIDNYIDFKLAEVLLANRCE